jgi:hypothetical protein
MRPQATAKGEIQSNGTGKSFNTEERTTQRAEDLWLFRFVYVRPRTRLFLMSKEKAHLLQGALFGIEIF